MRFDRRRRCIARCFGLADGLLKAGQLPVDLGQPVGAKQPLGRRRSAADADKAVPAPHDAVASHQPLPDSQRLAAILIGHPDLRQSPMECAGASTWSSKRSSPAASGGSPA